jgi:thiosulfate/3-mercaptopyruvate sulfurtransferase
MRSSLLWAAGALVLVAVAGHPAEGQNKADVLVSTDWVAEQLATESIVLLHVGMGHTGPPEAVIQGARLVDYHSIAVDTEELSTEIADVASLEDAFRDAGVNNDDHVVVYGSGSAHLAARVFMTLEYLGHRGKVSVMDGGLEVWQSEGRPTVSAPAEPKRGTFEAQVAGDILVTADDIAKRLDDPRMTLIDARPAVEYTGQRARGRGGHIPGAYNLYWEDLIESEDQPRLKNLAAVQARFDEAGASKDGVVVNYCMIGMRASYTYLISRHLGYDTRFYDGSWNDWGAREDLPAVEGASRN